MKRAPSQPPNLPGYEFIRLLGSGGFSDVFLYEQRMPRRQVAVKVLLAETLTPQTRKQFADEANLMASLSAHPNIVAIYHADVSHDGRPYFVMEYCSGPSLAARYKAKPFDIEEALRIGVRLSGAVATAHAAGILHRDIKPANVLMNAYGAPALTDFGISTAAEDDVGLTTTVGSLTDSPAMGATSVGMSVPWSPPEVFADHPVADVRSDIFSLAATLYTLLAGHTPFEKPGGSNSQLDLARRIQRGEMTPLARTDVSASLRGVLLKGMDPSPSARYERATDFARALQAVEVELGYHATPLEVPRDVVDKRIDDESNSAEETRVRGVVAVNAQPVAQQAQREPEPVTVIDASDERLSAESLDSTVVRITAPTVPDPREAVAPARRTKAPLVVGGLVSVVVVAAVVTAILVPRPETYVPVGGTPDTGQNTGDDESPGGVIVPIAQIFEPQWAPDGASVTFEWENPNAEDGDSFLWQRTDDVGGPRNPTTQTSTTIEGVSPGDEVCISVWVNRKGQLSADPAQVCA